MAEKNKTQKTDLELITEEIEKSQRTFSGMVSFNDLFTSEFLSSHTQYSNFLALLDAGNYKINGLSDFNAIQTPEFDEFINKVTEFKSWEEMQKAAINEYFEHKKH